MMKIRGSSSAERSSVLLVHARRKVKCSTGSCSLSSFSTLSSSLQNTTDNRAGLKTSSVRHTDVYRYLNNIKQFKRNIIHSLTEKY